MCTGTSSSRSSREEKNMPLLDHFHAPLHPRRHWESFHSAWATTIVNDLMERLLPPGYFAEELIHQGPRVEIDVATFGEGNGNGEPSGADSTPASPWTPPAPLLV